MSDLSTKVPTQDDLNSQALRAIAYYLGRQREEARKTPGITRVTTINLLNPTAPPTALQIVPKNDKRESVAITNAGPADCIFSERWFDPTTILQWFSDPNDPSTPTPGFNQMVPIGYLIKGNSVTLDGTTGVWAYSLASATGSNQNAILSIADSIYDATTGVPMSMAGWDKMDGLLPAEQPGGGIIN